MHGINPQYSNKSAPRPSGSTSESASCPNSGSFLHDISHGVGDVVNELVQHDTAESRGSSKTDKLIEIVYTI